MFRGVRIAAVFMLTASGQVTQAAAPNRSTSPSSAAQPAELSAVAVQMQRRLEPYTPPGYQLLDILVWGNGSIDLASYDQDLRAEILQYQQRYEAYTPQISGTDDGLGGMGINAQVRYERRMAAISPLPGTAEMARAYVAELRPCYEWEGYSDCPAREAKFAAAYGASHPESPFKDYLPLLEAHRWICAVEGWDYKDTPSAANTSLVAYHKALSIALKSPSLMVRTAAVELSERNRCNL